MPFAKYGTRRSFSRSESVDVVTREVTLLPDTSDAKDYVEIREYLKPADVYGHGILIPVDNLPNLINDLVAFTQKESE